MLICEIFVVKIFILIYDISVTIAFILLFPTVWPHSSSQGIQEWPPWSGQATFAGSH